MQVVLEKPVTWLQSKRDGCRNRLMYETLTAALRKLGMIIKEVDTYYGRDFMPRRAPPGGVLLSYHSVGNSKNVWRIKETPIPYFYNIDRLGYSGWSELAVESEMHTKRIEQIDEKDAQSYCEGVANWLRTENLSKYEQSNSPFRIRSGFIFYPLQVRDDPVSAHNRIDPLDVLAVSARAARAHKKILVVKRHPYCRSARTLLNLVTHRATNKYVRVTSSSVSSLLSACDAVVVGNSGVGLESLVYGKPVYTFAASEYEISSFRIDNIRDLQSIFSLNKHTRHPMSYNFISYFLRERCFDARSLDDATRKLAPILESTDQSRLL